MAINAEQNVYGYGSYLRRVYTQVQQQQQWMCHHQQQFFHNK